MIPAQRAPVRPRILDPASGAELPLESRVLELLARRARGFINVVGGPGSGKTTALQHLAAVLPADAPVLLLDESDRIDVARAESDCLVVRAVTAAPAERASAYRLLAWTDDDLIEYLLANHHEQCASIMARLHPVDRALLRGVPELWRIVLDHMADEDAVRDASRILKHEVRVHLPAPKLVDLARQRSLHVVTVPSKASAAELFGQAGFGEPAVRLLRHPQIHIALAAERIAADFRQRAPCDYLTLSLRRELVRAVGDEVKADPDLLAYVEDMFAGGVHPQPMPASILHVANPGWAPRNIRPAPCLIGAYLDHAIWRGVQLPQAVLEQADFSHADLSGANLEEAVASCIHLRRACLSQALLTGATFRDAVAPGVNLSSARAARSNWDHANLEGAILRSALLAGACFSGANLVSADFTGANLVAATFSSARLTDTDFSRADLRLANLSRLCLRDAVLTGACLKDANLSGCDLEEMVLIGIDARHAKLEDALLTGAVLTDANLEEACLRDTGLGEVNMERACLRDADLRGATFHMGSSRSGMLFTPIASEGSRTGFYTDDADDQNFKAPEEIRKANLRGADLRGACIDDVDFYLVDLREALYDAKQEEHFRQCRAILGRGCEDEP